MEPEGIQSREETLRLFIEIFKVPKESYNDFLDGLMILQLLGHCTKMLSIEWKKPKFNNSFDYRNYPMWLHFSRGLLIPSNLVNSNAIYFSSPRHYITHSSGDISELASISSLRNIGPSDDNFGWVLSQYEVKIVNFIIVEEKLGEVIIKFKLFSYLEKESNKIYLFLLPRILPDNPNFAILNPIYERVLRKALFRFKSKKEALQIEQNI